MHLDTKIVPFGCDPTFGNPSGHSLFAWTSAVTIILDIFHSVPVTFYYDGDSIYHGWFAYCSSMFLALYWMITIPFGRYIGGVHSMDQIIFGSLIGLWVALFSHFLVRDNIIWFFEKVILWQDSSRGALNWGLIPQFSDPNKQKAFIKAYTQYDLDKILEKTLKGQARYNDRAEFRPNWFCFFAFFLWVAIHGAGLTAFILDN